MTERLDRAPLFDDLVREDQTPADHLETSFQFLNRAGSPFWSQVRDLVQEWLDHVPDDDAYKDLRGRLRSDDAANGSAFLELYLHEMFLRAGYHLTIHPAVPHGSRRPDFLVEGYGDSFYLEATMPGPTASGVGQAQRRSAFLDTIQGCQNHDFFLRLDRLAIGTQPARGREARSLIERWLDELDPTTVDPATSRSGTFRWAKEGWEAEFSAIPISPQHRGHRHHRPIGIYADQSVEVIDDASLIRSALASKANRYGRLDRPLVIALGTYIWDRDHWHAIKALYGHAGLTWWESSDVTVGQSATRRPEGFFGMPDEWRNKGVAAVLHVNQLQPSHVHKAEVTLWPHPGSTHRWDNVVSRIPTAQVRMGPSMLDTSAPLIDSANHFGLSEPWPVGDAFPVG